MSVPVLILFGPTASGKTGIVKRLADLAARGIGSYRGIELVSADSMQVYRGMDLGTAKPSPEERRRIPHHLIDIRDPNEQFNAGEFVRLADECCAQIAGRGALPVVSGGTGFYLKNFILGLSEAPPSDGAIRAALREELRLRGAAGLMEELRRVDPPSAGRIHLNDTYRLLRALEVFRAGGRPLSSYRANAGGGEDAPGRGDAVGEAPGRGDAAPSRGGRYRFLITGLEREREDLYRRIDERCALMFRRGLAAEVRALTERGYGPDDPGLKAIGYREFFVFPPERAGVPDKVDGPEKAPESGGEGSPSGGGESPAGRNFALSEHPAEVEALAARNSRRYAKRQITYFASIPFVHWIRLGKGGEGALRAAAEQIRAMAEAFFGPSRT